MSVSLNHGTVLKKEGTAEQKESDVEVVFTQITPYGDEPLAELDDDREIESTDNQEADEDGLTPAALEARYEQQVAVNSRFI